MLLVDRKVARYFATNCWVIATGAGQECVVVDPGIGEPSLAKEVRELVAAHQLKISAILVTHGHLDHSFSIAPLQNDVNSGKVLVHRSDRDLLADPTLALGAAGMQMFQELSNRYGATFQEPSDIEVLGDDQLIDLAGMKMRIINTPGHTPGSIIAVVDDTHLISGDTLFAGSIGRTDLPRGSAADMQISLREKIAVLPGDLAVLPGHGDPTTIAAELRSNPYLKAAVQGVM